MPKKVPGTGVSGQSLRIVRVLRAVLSKARVFLHLLPGVHVHKLQKVWESHRPLFSISRPQSPAHSLGSTWNEVMRVQAPPAAVASRGPRWASPPQPQPEFCLGRSEAALGSLWNRHTHTHGVPHLSSFPELNFS